MSSTPSSQRGYTSAMRIVALVSLLGLVSAGSRAPSCNDNIREGIDIKGGAIINDGKADKTTNDYDCCQKCQDREECKFWTRVQYDTPEGSEEGECWLRSSIGEKIEGDSAYNSGARLGAIVSDSCIIRERFEFTGHFTLNDGKKDITNSDEECCQKCAQRSDCIYWTRVQQDTSKGSKKGECWLRQNYESLEFPEWEFNSGGKTDW